MCRCSCHETQTPLTTGETWIFIVIVAACSTVSITGMVTIARFVWGLLK